MNKYPNIKYLAFDLDDTLLTRKKEVTPLTIKTLKKAQEKGFKIVINTARSMQASKVVADLIHPDYGIYSGGCHIVDKDGKTIFSKTIPAEVTKEATKYLIQKCEKISVQTKENFYASDEEYKAQNAIHYDFSDGLNEEAYKILCFSYDLDMVKDVAKKFNLELQNYLNGGWNRLSVLGSTKWNGIVRLAKVINETTDKFACFGDDTGDIDMIVNSGLGVAMANSKEQLLKVAPNITLSNEEEGCAHFIIDNLL